MLLLPQTPRDRETPPPEPIPPQETPIAPAQLWESLTSEQRVPLFHCLVRCCRSLTAPPEEEPHELR